MGRWLKGHPATPARPGGQAPGWHPVEWLCEAGGTGFQLFFGFSAVALFESPYSPLHPDLPGWARFVVIGSCFGLLGAMVAVSPLGRCSGAHLNPSVTLGFVLRGHTSVRDATGFIAGQAVGALAAAALFAQVWGRWATSVDTARTAPEAGPPAGAVAAVAVFDVVARGRRTLTAKLFHDPAYPSVHATALPARPHPGQARPGPAPAPGPVQAVADAG